MLLSDQFCATADWGKLKESLDEERNLSERMPEKKEVRKTKPIARDPTIAEERERKKPQRKEDKI